MLSMLGQDAAGAGRVPGRGDDQGRGAGPRAAAWACAPPPSRTARTCASSGAPRGGRASWPERMALHPARGRRRPRAGRPASVAAVELVTVGQRRGMGHGADGRRRYVTHVDVARAAGHGRQRGGGGCARRSCCRALADVGGPAARRRRPRRGAGQRARPPGALHRGTTDGAGRVVRFDDPQRPVAPGRRWRSTTRSTPTPWSARASRPDRGAARRPRPARRRRAPPSCAQLIDRPQRAVPRARRARDPRRRVRPPRRGAAPARGRLPRAGHARLADPDGRAPPPRALPGGAPPRADDEPRQRLRRGRAAGLGRAAAASGPDLDLEHARVLDASRRSTASPCR